MSNEDINFHLLPESIMKSAHDCVVAPHIEDTLTAFLEEDLSLRNMRKLDMSVTHKHLSIHRQFLRLAEQQSIRKIATLFQPNILQRHGLSMFYPVFDKTTRRVYVGLNRAKGMSGNEFSERAKAVCLDADGVPFNFKFQHKGVVMRVWLHVQLNVLTGSSLVFND